MGLFDNPSYLPLVLGLNQIIGSTALQSPGMLSLFGGKTGGGLDGSALAQANAGVPPGGVPLVPETARVPSALKPERQIAGDAAEFATSLVPGVGPALSIGLGHFRKRHDEKATDRYNSEIARLHQQNVSAMGENDRIRQDMQDQQDQQDAESKHHDFFDQLLAALKSNPYTGAM